MDEARFVERSRASSAREMPEVEVKFFITDLEILYGIMYAAIINRNACIYEKKKYNQRYSKIEQPSGSLYIKDLKWLLH